MRVFVACATLALASTTLAGHANTTTTAAGYGVVPVPDNGSSAHTGLSSEVKPVIASSNHSASLNTSLELSRATIVTRYGTASASASTTMANTSAVGAIANSSPIIATVYKTTTITGPTVTQHALTVTITTTSLGTISVCAASSNEALRASDAITKITSTKTHTDTLTVSTAPISSSATESTTKRLVDSSSSSVAISANSTEGHDLTTTLHLTRTSTSRATLTSTIRSTSGQRHETFAAGVSTSEQEKSTTSNRITRTSRLTETLHKTKTLHKSVGTGSPSFTFTNKNTTTTTPTVHTYSFVSKPTNIVITASSGLNISQSSSAVDAIATSAPGTEKTSGFSLTTHFVSESSPCSTATTSVGLSLGPIEASLPGQSSTLRLSNLTSSFTIDAPETAVYYSSPTYGSPIALTTKSNADASGYSARLQRRYAFPANASTPCTEHSQNVATTAVTSPSSTPLSALVTGVPIGISGTGPSSFISLSSLLAITASASTTAKSRPSLIATTGPSKQIGTVGASGIHKPVYTNATTLATATKSALPATTSCGESGSFTLTWDDEPNTSSDQPPPVFNPYHHLFFANGYTYINDDNEPFRAVSGPTLALWTHENTVDRGSPFAAGLRAGEIGAGPRGALNAWWFNVDSAYFGCPYEGSSQCILDISGYQWNSSSNQESIAAHQTVKIPSCTDRKNCSLRHVEFDDDMTQLSGIQFVMYIELQHQLLAMPFLMDNLAMGWWNNSCEAGLMRISQRK